MVRNIYKEKEVIISSKVIFSINNIRILTNIHQKHANTCYFMIQWNK